MTNLQKRPNGKWRARYRDSGGRQHARHFARKVDAQRWLDEVTASVVTGQYVDPKAGQVTFKAYAEQWRAAQVHRPSSAAHVETMLRRHAYPVLGDRPLASILPSEIQAWVKRLRSGHGEQKALAPSTVNVVHGIVSTVFKAAMRDRRIMANPCEGTKLPTVERKKVIPLETAQVEAAREEMPDSLRALVTFAAGVGPRPSEAFGLTVDRLDMLRRTVRIDRQLLGVDAAGRPRFGPVKTKASDRVVPFGQVVADELALHLKMFPPGEHGLVFTIEGEPITRQRFGHLWRPVATTLGLPSGTAMHALRHYYASLLIRHGESVKVVQARLGHATAAETLDTYSHLWPDADDRTREAIDEALPRDRTEAPGDSSGTAPG